MCNLVAPHAGAWIEMLMPEILLSRVILSLPTRERGLKSRKHHKSVIVGMSLPTRERGLKCQNPHEQVIDLGRSPRGSVD